MDTENKEINLPENIKEEIRKNVTELKDILKEDSEYAESLIHLVSNVYQGKYPPQGIADVVYTHYSDVVKKCQEQYKPFPIEITKLYNIIDLLTHLVSGQDKLIYDEFKNSNDDYDTIKTKIDILAELCSKEVCFQFNPEILYGADINAEYLTYCQQKGIGEHLDYPVQCTGEDLEDL